MFKFNIEESFACCPETLLERSTLSFSDYEKYMPNIEKVELVSKRQLDESREEAVVEFFAKSKVPAVARQFMPDNRISWKETFLIDRKNNTVDWRVEAPVFTEYVDCSGTSDCIETENGSRLCIRGAMVIRTPVDEGISVAIGKVMAAVLEPFIGNMVSLNLRKYFRSLKREFSGDDR